MSISDDISRRQIDEYEAERTDTNSPAQVREHIEGKGKGKDIKSSTEASSAGEDAEQQDKILELIKKMMTALLGKILS
jgi:hypothetical protein